VDPLRGGWAPPSVAAPWALPRCAPARGSEAPLPNAPTEPLRWLHAAAPSVYGTALLSMLSIASCVAAPPCWALGAGVQGGGTQPPVLSSGRGWLGLGLGLGLEFGLGLGLGLG